VSSRSTELKLIEIIKKEVSSETTLTSVITDIGDDCVILRPTKETDLVVTKDCMVEGVHFDLSYTSPYFIGRKLATSNLSDIGAAGGRPLWALLGLGFRSDFSTAFYQSFFKGLLTSLKREGVGLVGGDTVSAKERLFFSLTLIGEVPKGKFLSRAKARPGDRIFVSGPLGDSQGGLFLLQNRIKPPIPRNPLKYLIKSHLDPSYPIGLGRRLLEFDLASSSIDVSDGLSTDLWHICERSKVRCIIDESAIPISRSLRLLSKAVHVRPLDFAISGGEDFEIIWTTPAHKAQEVKKVASKLLKRPPYEIGYVEEGKGVFLKDSRGKLREIGRLGYEHR